jgi:putative oxygen-independent coproporphyrinogen III oxidase
MSLPPLPLSLYVHMPWCVRKCPYCDFNSHVAPERVPDTEYIDALLADLDNDLPYVGDRALISIFFGGGTPSLFPPEAIGRFIEGVRTRLACVSDMEVTLEANPGTIEHGRFSGYRGAGVTRVSLGAQSFNETHLKALGRIHGVDDIGRAVDELVTAGLTNFNLDLMYGLPDQTTEQALADLRAALALEPTHLSQYQLTLEPGTVFYHRPPPLPDSDATWEMQVACQELLGHRGFEQYEVSAYAQRGARCRHNLNYWQFGDYLGIGAGAHGKLTLHDEGRVLRTQRHRQPREYLARLAAKRACERAEVPREELPFEFMLNALRLIDGFATELFVARTGLGEDSIAHQLGVAERSGLIQRASPAGWRPTDLGQRFLNDLQALFLPESASSGTRH